MEIITNLKMNISVVIPVYNEVDSVAQLYKELIKVLDKSRFFEILVDRS